MASDIASATGIVVSAYFDQWLAHGRTRVRTKWGMIPWLHTYKQVCIRLAKAKEFEQALWWAERGLAVYGENAGRPDAVEDLRKRAETYRAKLARPIL